MPSGGAGTGSALTGLAVPDWLKNVPSLPSWSAFVQEVSPPSNPPFAMTGIAWTDDVAATPSTTATIVKTVMRTGVFIRTPPPVRIARHNRLAIPSLLNADPHGADVLSASLAV